MSERESDGESDMEHMKYTKIELNLENSQDEVDFVGYGQLRVSNKKKSKSPEKNSSKKATPAPGIRIGDEKRLVSTKLFTPLTNKSMTIKRSQNEWTEVKEGVPEPEKQVSWLLHRPRKLFSTTGNTTCSKRT